MSEASATFALIRDPLVKVCADVPAHEIRHVVRMNDGIDLRPADIETNLQTLRQAFGLVKRDVAAFLATMSGPAAPSRTDR